MWILELLKFLFSFVPSIQIVEPDTRQVICFIKWVWVRQPGLRIQWPFWLAEQTNVNVSDIFCEGFYVTDMMRTNWEATVAVECPKTFVYTICGDELELIGSVINRCLRSDEEPQEELRKYGIRVVDIQEVQNGVPVICLGQ